MLILTGVTDHWEDQADLNVKKLRQSRMGSLMRVMEVRDRLFCLRDGRGSGGWMMRDM